MMIERFSCFIMMPYSEESDKVYSEAILPAIQDLKQANVIMLRADEMGRTALTLKAHIQDAVSSADFYIADLSGFNPNVMYELGYATSLKKPTILIRRKPGKIPVNISETDILTYSLNDLKGLHTELTQRCEKVLQYLIKTRITGEQETACLLIFDPSIFNRFFQSIRNRLIVITDSPKMIIDQLLPIILSGKLKDARIQLVCADPESEFVRFRARDIGISVASLRNEMRSMLNQLYDELVRQKTYSTELRVTDYFIANSIYVADDQALIFPYINRRQDQLVLSVDRLDNQKIFGMFQHQALNIWQQSTELASYKTYL